VSEPAAPGTITEIAALPAAPSDALAGVRVLVVDDEPDARDLITTVLAQYSAQTSAAASAAAALETLDLWRPDALVIDIAMPGEDGYNLIRRIRALGPERGGHIPAIALTAYARAEDRARAIAAGYQKHVAKPVEPSQLAAIVADVAGRGARARGT
jgi:hypothetical protein